MLDRYRTMNWAMAITDVLLWGLIVLSIYLLINEAVRLYNEWGSGPKDK